MLNILEIKDLNKSYTFSKGIFGTKEEKQVLKDFSMELKKGERLGLVGDSGKGKSTIAKCLVNIEEADSGRIYIDNKLVFEKNKVNRYSELSVKKKIQIIMQDSSAALNPKKRVGDLIAKAVLLYNKEMKKEEARKIVEKYFELCGIQKEFYERYPHEMSGGQRQRVCIARALVLEPDIIICDEITSALDVSIQAQILNLMLDLQEKLGLSYIFISHDKEVVDCFCNRIIRL